MASIPLLCNICPKHPDFSDVSHLLTHVSSKGHLSHYFKAQVRSRQEPQLLRQLEVYDRWYDEYHIEKLLSQRMTLKESKTATNGIRNVKSKPSTSIKPAKYPKKPSKVEAAVLHRGPQIKDENVIDPQLSQDQTTPATALPRGRSLSLDRPFPGPSQHRAFAPRMRAWPANSPRPYGNQRVEGNEPQPTPHAAHAAHAVYSESGSDSEQLFLLSPTKSIYPDPSTISGPPHMGELRSSSPIVEHYHEYIQDEAELEGPPPSVAESESTQSPKLKGICWPGMDIFDSASPVAQRQRNQKKNDSILKQMELNSIVVEPLEQIFWPEGTLKKERIITGMVESSPLKEDSPKPRRKRNTRDKRIPKSASINNPRVAKSSGLPKLSYPHETSHPADLGDLSKRAIAMLDTPPPAYLATPNLQCEFAESGDIEWEMTAGDSKAGRKRRFVVYDDDATEDELEQSKDSMASKSRIPDIPFLHRPYGQVISDQSPGFIHSNLEMPFPTPGNDYPDCGVDYGVAASNGRDFNHQSHGLPITVDSRSGVNKENIEPMLNPSGQIEDRVAHPNHGRNAQRYFAVTRGCPPEFFDTLPSQMDFGGWPGPRLSSSSSNPLNPSGQLYSYQGQQSYQPDSRLLTSASARGISPLRTTTTSPPARNHEHFFGKRSLRVEGMSTNPRHEQS